MKKKKIGLIACTYYIHTCVEFSGLVVIVILDGDVVIVISALWCCVVSIGRSKSAPALSDFRLDDGEPVVAAAAAAAESLSLFLFMITETVDGAAVVAVTLLVVSLATAVAINDADAVSLMTICCTTPVFGLSSTSIAVELMLLVVLLNSIKSTDFCCCVDDIFASFLFLFFCYLNVSYQIQLNSN